MYYLFLGSGGGCSGTDPVGQTLPPQESSVSGSTNSSASGPPSLVGGRRKSEAAPAQFQIVREGLPELRVKFRRLHPVDSSRVLLPPPSSDPVSRPLLPPLSLGPGCRTPRWLPPPSATRPAPRSLTPPRRPHPALDLAPPRTCSRTAWRRAPCTPMTSPASPWTPPPGASTGQDMKVS